MERLFNQTLNSNNTLEKILFINCFLMIFLMIFLIIFFEFFFTEWRTKAIISVCVILLLSLLYLVKSHLRNIVVIKLFNTVINNMTDGLVIRNKQSGFIFTNPKIRKIMGLNEEPAANIDIEKILGKKIPENPNELSEIDFVTKAGESKFLLYSDQPAFIENRIQGHIGIVTDITSLRKTEKILKTTENRLRESEELCEDLPEKRFRTIVQNLPVLVNALDSEGNYIFWNKACEDLTGYTHDEIVSNSEALRMLYPEDIYYNEVITVWSNRKSSFRDQKLTLTCKDGLKKTILWSTITNEEQLSGWFDWTIGIDITKRMEVQDALRESEEQFRAVLNTLNEGVAIIDENTKAEYVNKKFFEITGYDNN